MKTKVEFFSSEDRKGSKLSFRVKTFRTAFALKLKRFTKLFSSQSMCVRVQFNQMEIFFDFSFEKFALFDELIAETLRLPVK